MTILAGKATVLYTFYPPMIAHWSFYVGAALLLGGAFLWLALALRREKRSPLRDVAGMVPEPVGAAIKVCRRCLIAGQARACASVSPTLPMPGSV